MYIKPSVGVFLVLTGIVASSSARPPAQAARILLEITGAGFLLYCLAAAGLFAAGCYLRRQGGRSGAEGAEGR